MPTMLRHMREGMDRDMENNRPKDESYEQSDVSHALAFHRRLVERSKMIPKEDKEEFPPDFSENLDYYLYGMPKRSP